MFATQNYLKAEADYRRGMLEAAPKVNRRTRAEARVPKRTGLRMKELLMFRSPRVAG